jgi:hypothetical protein
MDGERARILQVKGAPPRGATAFVSTPNAAANRHGRRSRIIPDVGMANNEKVIDLSQVSPVRMNRTPSVAPARRCDAMRHRSHDGRRGARAKDRVLMPALAFRKIARSLRVGPPARRNFVASAK